MSIESYQKYPDQPDILIEGSEVCPTSSDWPITDMPSLFSAQQILSDSFSRQKSGTELSERETSDKDLETATLRLGSNAVNHVISSKDNSWENDALCRGEDTELFYSSSASDIKDAKKVCASCVVRTECLTVALEKYETFGVWGGTTARERRRKFKR